MRIPSARMLLAWLGTFVVFAASPAPAQTERAQLNTLRGVVVSKLDGKPVADLPVVMAHAARGSLTLRPDEIAASGEELATGETFARRNARAFCDAVSGPDGSFTLRSFGAPDERWMIAAGDAARGFFLRMDVIPKDYAETPLRIELETPAFLVARKPAAPENESFRASIDLALLAASGDGPPAAQDACGTGDTHVYVHAWPADPNAADWRLGPLPPGFSYRVARTIWSPELRYTITLFERVVRLAPGANEAVVLEAGPGATLTGRLTDTKGRPLANVNVLARLEGPGGVTIGGLSDEDGRYTLRGLPPGRHTLELLRHAKPTAPI